MGIAPPSTRRAPSPPTTSWCLRAPGGRHASVPADRPHDAMPPGDQPPTRAPTICSTPSRPNSTGSSSCSTAATRTSSTPTWPALPPAARRDPAVARPVAEAVLLEGDKPAARALGRLELTPDAVDIEDATSRSATRRQQRERGDVGAAAAAAHGQGRGGLPGAHALRDARVRIDAMHFGLVVPDALYAALEPEMADIREAVANSKGWSASPTCSTRRGQRSAAADVRAFNLRLPGAPRGAWAGYARPLADGALASTGRRHADGGEQARAAFLDRHRLWSGAGGSADIVDFPALFDSLTSNAYIAPSLGCTHTLPGCFPTCSTRATTPTRCARASESSPSSLRTVAAVRRRPARSLMDTYGDVESVRYDRPADGNRYRPGAGRRVRASCAATSSSCGAGDDLPRAIPLLMTSAASRRHAEAPGGERARRHAVRAHEAARSRACTSSSSTRRRAALIGHTRNDATFTSAPARAAAGGLRIKNDKRVMLLPQDAALGDRHRRQAARGGDSATSSTGSSTSSPAARARAPAAPPFSALST